MFFYFTSYIRNQRFEGNPLFWSFMSPTNPFLFLFYSEIFDIWSFMSGNFFRKISEKFPEIFSTLSKSKKTIIFVTQLVQNDYIDQNLVKFFHKTQKRANFSLKTLIFPNFRRLRCRNFDVLGPSGPDFLELGSPLLVEVPQTTSG